MARAQEMTVGVARSPLSQPADNSSADRAGALVRALAAAPERLLLIFLWFGYICAAAYVSGFFRPAVVFPVTAVVVLLTWRLSRYDGPRDVRAAVGSAAGLVVAGAWFVTNLPYIAERVAVTRDPDLYTLTALWLVDHASPSIPMSAASEGSLGFPLVDGALRPQGNHLVAGVSATVGWVFGQEAVFWGNLLCGAAALLALYVLARRLVGPFWALVPMLALAGSMPMLEFSRALYSEPLAMTFTFLGTTLLWSAWKRDRALDYVLAGVSFGAVALARIDGTLPLIGVIAGLTVAAFLDPDRPTNRRRWAAPLVLAGSLPGVLLGYADLYFHTGTYVTDLGGQLTMLLQALVLVAVLGLVGALWRIRADRLATVRRVLSRLSVGLAALLAVGVAVLLSRPFWYVSHGPGPNGLVASVQEREGDLVDGTRTYAEYTLNWLSWYYSWPVVLIGLAGLIAWLVLGTRGKPHFLWLAALFLPSALLYLTQPNITPDQIWALRRFLPVVVPGLLLAAAWVTRELVTRISVRQRAIGAVLAAAFVLSALAWPLMTTRPLATTKEKAGALDGNRRVCEQIDGRPTIVTGIDTYLPTVRVLCDVPAVSVPEPTPRLLAEARQALGGGDVVLVTRGPGTVPWAGEQPAPVSYKQRVWEESLAAAPDEVFEQTVQVTMGRVRPDGTVAALAD
jgi:hypothetical protein